MSLEMDKIDVHVHCGPYNVSLIRNTTFEGLTGNLMPRANIKIACISHTESVFHEMTRGNARLFRALEHYPQLRGYIYVDPLRPEESVREIERYASHPQAVGIKSRSDYHGVPFDGPEYRRILEAAERHGLAMLHHTFSPEVARQMASVIGSVDMNFIIAHSGGGSWRTVVPMLAEYPNAYMDLCSSIIDRGKARAIAGMVGVDRMVFGSDMNLISPFWTIGMFEEGGFTEEELRRIYWDNARQVIGDRL
ncbi:MAG: amidohydrolase [Anaerolineae bacterium]|nr:amidohydrolase [Anaerolineae bacterium]